jgi:hypothetical protein
MGHKEVSHPVTQELRFFATVEGKPKKFLEPHTIVRQPARDVVYGRLRRFKLRDLAHPWIDRSCLALPVGNGWAGWGALHLGNDLPAGLGIEETPDHLQIKMSA